MSLAHIREDGRCVAHGEGMETFLACGVPDLITKYAVFETALLGEECGADCGLFVGLEFIGDLCGLSRRERTRNVTRGKQHTKRRTTEDLPTAASPG